MILSDSETFRVEPGALPEPAASDRKAPVTMGVNGDGGERTRIETALARSRGRVAGPNGAAKELGMPASTLEWKIIRLGIDKHRFRSRLS